MVVVDVEMFGFKARFSLVFLNEKNFSMFVSPEEEVCTMEEVKEEEERKRKEEKLGRVFVSERELVNCEGRRLQRKKEETG